MGLLFVRMGQAFHRNDPDLVEHVARRSGRRQRVSARLRARLAPASTWTAAVRVARRRGVEHRAGRMGGAPRTSPVDSGRMPSRGQDGRRGEHPQRARRAGSVRLAGRSHARHPGFTFAARAARSRVRDPRPSTTSADATARSCRWSSKSCRAHRRSRSPFRFRRRPSSRNAAIDFSSGPRLTTPSTTGAPSSGWDGVAFTRAFRKETGLSFGEWRQQACMLVSLPRLAAGDAVTTIALDLGYESPAAFTTMFQADHWRRAQPLSTP